MYDLNDLQEMMICLMRGTSFVPPLLVFLPFYPPIQIVGATGSTTIAFILPGLLYLKVHPEPHPKRSLAALQLTVGLFIIPVALTFIALGDPPEGR